MTNKYLIVFDTTTLLQSLLSPRGPAAKCVAYFRRGEIDIAVSRETLNEAKDVLTRSSLQERYSQLTDVKAKASALIDFLYYRGIYLRVVRRWFEYPRDPKDEPFLNLSIEAEADYLISRDNDLLDLMSWEKDEGREFQKRFRFLKIISPEVFLRVMEQEQSSQQ